MVMRRDYLLPKLPEPPVLEARVERGLGVPGGLPPASSVLLVCPAESWAGHKYPVLVSGFASVRIGSCNCWSSSWGGRERDRSSDRERPCVRGCG